MKQRGIVGRRSRAASLPRRSLGGTLLTDETGGDTNLTRGTTTKLFGSVLVISLLTVSLVVTATHNLTVGISAAPAIERTEGEIVWHAGYLLETSWTTTAGLRVGMGIRGDFALSAVSLRARLQMPVSTAVEITVGVEAGWIDLHEFVSFLTAAHLDLGLRSVSLDPFGFRVDLTLLLAELVARGGEGLIGAYVGFPRSGSITVSGQAAASWTFAEKIGISFVPVDTTELTDPVGAVSDTLLFMAAFTTLVRYAPPSHTDDRLPLAVPIPGR